MAAETEFVPSRPKPSIFRRLRRSMFALVPFVVWIGGVAGHRVAIIEQIPDTVGIGIVGVREQCICAHCRISEIVCYLPLDQVVTCRE